MRRPSAPPSLTPKSASIPSTSSRSPGAPWTTCAAANGNQAAKSKTAPGRLVKGVRWSLLKAPEGQNTWQLAALHEVSKTNRRLYRAFLLKEQLRLL